MTPDVRGAQLGHCLVRDAQMAATDLEQRHEDQCHDRCNRRPPRGSQSRPRIGYGPTSSLAPGPVIARTTRGIRIGTRPRPTSPLQNARSDPPAHNGRIMRPAADAVRVDGRATWVGFGTLVPVRSSAFGADWPSRPD
jgi:hypothetical protein